MLMRSVGAVLILLFGVFLFYVSRPEFVAKVEDFSPLDWAALFFVPVAVLVAHFVNRFNKNKRLSSRDIFWLSVALMSVVLVSTLIFWITAETARAILLGSYFASLGWIYTNYANGVMHRKSHTMNILVQMRNSVELQKHRHCVLGRFPFGRAVTNNDMDELKRERAQAESYKDGRCPILDSAYYVTNYYEFISIAVENGDLDDTMIEHTLRGIFVNWFKHIEPIVHDARIQLNGSQNPRTYRAYIALAERYDQMVRPVA